MNAYTVIVRELRRLARRAGTFRSRSTVVSLAIGVAVLVSLGIDFGFIRSGMPKGQAIIVSLSCLLMIVSSLLGVAATSDCLSEERREGTLGLLFLTPLTSFDLLLGKLVSSSLQTVYALISLMPVVGLALVFGGVTWGEFVRHSLVLGNTLFLALALGLFVSAASHDARKAFTSGLGLVLLFALGPFVVTHWGLWLIASPSFDDRWGLLMVSPIYWLSLSGSFSGGFVDLSRFGLALLVGQGVGWAFICLGAFVLKRAFFEPRADHLVPEGGSADRAKVSSGDGGRRQRLLDVDPYVWIFHREVGRRFRVLLFTLTMMLLAVLSVKKYPSMLEFHTFFLFVTLVFLKIWLLVETVVRVNEERRSGSFELLLTTPLGLFGMMRGLHKGLVVQFAWGIVSVLAVAFWLKAGVGQSQSTAFAGFLERSFGPS